MLKNLKRGIGLAASRIAIIGNYMLKRPKQSTIEVVATKEEEEEEEDFYQHHHELYQRDYERV